MSNYESVVNFVAENSDPRLDWEFKLPPSIDAGRIEIDTEHLFAFQRLGGFVASRIYDYQGDRSASSYGVSGMNRDGRPVLGGLVTITVTRVSTTTLEDFSDSFSPDDHKVISRHGLNKAEMANKVSDAIRYDGKTHEQAWATELDRLLRPSLRSASFQRMGTQKGLRQMGRHARVCALTMASGLIRARD